MHLPAHATTHFCLLILLKGQGCLGNFLMYYLHSLPVLTTYSKKKEGDALKSVNGKQSKGHFKLFVAQVINISAFLLMLYFILLVQSAQMGCCDPSFDLRTPRSTERVNLMILFGLQFSEY